ncbi:TetR/AcrR family transcriptional regulator [Polynucleobacter sp. AP-Melu-500A-A1]|uniref:TetR/AcrR family transcriptional regulator n=1 Tax=Polynucleobacter sp. AP-Melu-500A-A1 TaxID=2576929 RepID=UPI001C0B8594|nr:TetR family transcriptional regulator [Polynucleobacter sp. AP-Melu-500A-A1]MBU3631478.1 TetR family transcriptional regulator [Polynucleobacter sp. AP-Melu-500A-A1]
MPSNFDAYFNYPSKQKRGEERVEKILDSIENALEENPDWEFNTRNIAQRAKISSGAIYHHFPSVGSLFASLFIRKVKKTQLITIDLINSLGPKVTLDEVSDLLVDHTFMVWSKGSLQIKKIVIEYFYRNAKEPELLYSFIDVLVPHFQAFVARNTTNTIRNIAKEEWPLILRTTQTAVSSPFIERQAIAGTEAHRQFAKDCLRRLLAK